MLGAEIQLVQMELGERLGIPAMTAPEDEVNPTPTPKRFESPWDQ